MTTLFDAHFHVIDPRFPLKENQGFLPQSFTCEEYLTKIQGLGVIGGAVVSGSFQGFDQSYLMAALEKLGQNFVGVTQLPFHSSDEEIIRLNDYGVKAIRFNVKRGGSENLSRLDYLARRVYDLVGWHVELYIDSTSLPEIAAMLKALPAISIDHLGLSKGGYKHLLSLVDKGVRVKATGFGRIELDVANAIREIYSVNPDALMFGTDLPSTRAKRHFKRSDIDLIVNILGEEPSQKVLFKNAMEWYLKTKRFEKK